MNALLMKDEDGKRLVMERVTISTTKHFPCPVMHMWWLERNLEHGGMRGAHLFCTQKMQKYVSHGEAWQTLQPSIAPSRVASLTRPLPWMRTNGPRRNDIEPQKDGIGQATARLNYHVPVDWFVTNAFQLF